VNTVNAHSSYIYILG